MTGGWRCIQGVLISAMKQFIETSRNMQNPLLNPMFRRDHMRAIVTKFGVLSLFLLLAVTGLAQDGKNMEKKSVEITGFRAEILGQIDFAAGRFGSLAEAMPEDKYGWRPGEGVRSVSEVFMHIAQANYGLPGVMGIKAPEGLPAKFEEITDKRVVVDHVNRSFKFLREGVANMSDADLEKKASFFGRDRTYREILILITTHFNQHLGQSIAYSRVNGIVPPWNDG